MQLEIRNLTKIYKRGTSSFNAVEDVNFKLSSGEFVSIVGCSGSGKSTLLNLVAGLLKPSSGEVLLDGENILRYTDNKQSYLRNSTIGYIPQGQSTLANLNVLDNVRVPFYFFKREGKEKQRAEELLEQMGISHLKNAYPNSLSGGEIRRVVIARALMNQPELLVADEPTSDLDTENTIEIMTLFRKIADEGTAVLLVTHDIETTLYGDEVYVMEAGRLKKQLIERKTVSSVY